MGFKNYAGKLKGVARGPGPAEAGVGGGSEFPAADPVGHIAGILHGSNAEKHTGARGLVLVAYGPEGGDQVARGRAEQGADRLHGVLPG